MQYLILPVDNCGVMSGFKNTNYKTYWGVSHWGIDYYDSSLVLKAMGEGKVLMNGYDNVFGNIIIIQYNDVYNHETKKSSDVICRMYHLANPSPISVGETVKQGQSIGVMGSTGKYSSGVHVHVEFDSDTQYYNYGGPLIADSNLIKKGYDDSLINPSYLLYKGANQKIYNKGYTGWVHDYEINLPSLEIKKDYEQLYNNLLNEYNNLVDENALLNDKYVNYKNALTQINTIVKGVL